jgi:hypothetical protein
VVFPGRRGGGPGLLPGPPHVAAGLVLGGQPVPGGGQQLLDLRQRPVRLLRRIPGQLGPVQAQQAQLNHAPRSQQPQHLAEKAAQRLLMPEARRLCDGLVYASSDLG